MPRVLLVEDHLLVRSGIRLLLERSRDMRIVGEADDGREAVALAKSLTPDLAIVDVGLPNLNGLQAVLQIRQESPRTRVLMLSMHAEIEYVREALRAGASGYVLKSAASTELMAAVHAILTGQKYISEKLLESLKKMPPNVRSGASPSDLTILTAREREILQLVAEGNSGPEIARDLAISERTVETHRQNIMTKLDIHTIAGLTRFALRHGLCFLDT
jgi:two-component system, NarL family, response regulator NreC